MSWTRVNRHLSPRGAYVVSYYEYDGNNFLEYYSQKLAKTDFKSLKLLKCFKIQIYYAVNLKILSSLTKGPNKTQGKNFPVDSLFF